MTKYVYDERTAPSAPICTFEDGVDGIPTKSLVVTIPPTLSGVSEVSAMQTERNLFNVADYSQIYTDRDGVDSYNYRYMIIHLKPNTTYTVSQNSGEAKSTPIVLINSTLPVGGSNYLDLRTASGSKTYTTGDDGYLYIGSVNSYDDVVYTRLQECKVQIEYGSTAHDYEPYQTPTVYTANLGRTIYGGTADIVNGTGTDENGNDFTFDGQEINTRLGYNAFWSEEGDTEVTYYIQIPVEEKYIINGETLSDIADAIREKKQTSDPILTEDMADEILSIVTGQEPQVPISSSTLIADNSTLSDTVTFTDDYHNYDILKIELARGDVSTVIYATPEMLDTIAQYSNNSINFNELGTNIYVCYWKTSSTVWTRRNNRSVNLKYIYGLKFTNCTPVKTVFYSRQAINGPWVSFSPPEGKSFIKDYDYILFSTKTGNDDETQPCNNVFCPTLIEKTISIFGDPFDNIYPIVLNTYNGTTKVTITDTTLTSYNYFYVVGIKLIFE